MWQAHSWRNLYHVLKEMENKSPKLCQHSAANCWKKSQCRHIQINIKDKGNVIDTKKNVIRKKGKQKLYKQDKTWQKIVKQLNQTTLMSSIFSSLVNLLVINMKGKDFLHSPSVLGGSKFNDKTVQQRKRWYKEEKKHEHFSIWKRLLFGENTIVKTNKASKLTKYSQEILNKN